MNVFELSNYFTTCFQVPLNIFHKLEISSFGLNFLDAVGLDFVDKFAEKNAILEDVLKGTSRKGLAHHLCDPAHYLSFELLIAGLPHATNQKVVLIYDNSMQDYSKF